MTQENPDQVPEQAGDPEQRLTPFGLDLDDIMPMPDRKGRPPQLSKAEQEYAEARRKLAEAMGVLARTEAAIASERDAAIAEIGSMNVRLAQSTNQLAEANAARYRFGRDMMLVMLAVSQIAVTVGVELVGKPTVNTSDDPIVTLDYDSFSFEIDPSRSCIRMHGPHSDADPIITLRLDRSSGIPENDLLALMVVCVMLTREAGALPKALTRRIDNTQSSYIKQWLSRHGSLEDILAAGILAPVQPLIDDRPEGPPKSPDKPTLNQDDESTGS